MATGARDRTIFLLCTALLVAPALHAKPLHTERLRPLGERLERLVRDGVRRSETFRTLVDRVAAGDLVVYVRSEPLPSGVHGRLSFLAAAAGVRYVLVAVSPDLDEGRAIAVLGHELRHAVEVLEQPEIVDLPTLARAYERGGSRRRRLADGGIGLDTLAAVHAGLQVWRELGASEAVIATR